MSPHRTNTRRKLSEFRLPTDEPPWVTRKRRVPVSFAAELKGISEDTYRRKYGSTIEQLSDRRQGVELGKVLDLCSTDSERLEVA